MKAADSRTYNDPVQLYIPGTPRPQPRPRFAKGRVIATADPLARRWTNACEFYARQTVMNLGGEKLVPHYLGAKGEALRVDLTFLFPTQRRNKERYGKPHLQVPDVDNLAKLVLDAFVRKGLIMGDDARVSELIVRKNWCRVQDAGCIATLTLLPPAKETIRKSEKLVSISNLESEKAD